MITTDLMIATDSPRYVRQNGRNHEFGAGRTRGKFRYQNYVG
jgi:hypothetical protein